MRLTVIANPAAGGGRALQRLPRIRNLLARQHEVSVALTSTPSSVHQQILDASGADAVLLAGGDGTLHHALPAILETGIPFGIIPLGRGNDFARNVGVPLELEASCAFAPVPRFRAVDIPSVNGTPFGSIASLGLDALVSRLARDHRGYFRGTAGYLVCVLKGLRRYRPIEVWIDIDGVAWHGRVVFVAIANGCSYGGGMKIAPQARPDDGLFTVCIVRELSRAELLIQFPKLFRGTHVDHPAVLFRTGRTVRVTSPEPAEIFADGEPAATAPAECTIRHHAAQVLLPDRA